MLYSNNIIHSVYTHTHTMVKNIILSNIIKLVLFLWSSISDSEVPLEMKGGVG
jgi:hypothetical protein